MDIETSPDVGAITIAIPFPPKLNDDLESARKRHLQWVANLHLWNSEKIQAAYEITDFPAFVARTYPSVHGAELDLINDFMGMNWLMDDAFDKPGIRKAATEETKRRLDEYRRVMKGQPSSAEGDEARLIAGFRDVITRVNKITSETWRQRHDPRWEVLFIAFQSEAENNAAGKVPTFNEYIQMRRGAAGVDICFDWVEATGHYELPVHIHANPVLLSMRKDAEDAIIMTNDVFSAHNEWNGGNTDNIIFVLAHEKQCSWRQASEATHKFIVDKINSFLHSEKLLLNCADYIALAIQDQTNLGRFIEGMKDWMKGSLDWHYACPRYKQEMGF